MSKTTVKPKANLWGAVSKTDPTFTKSYTGKGGFSGTSINATYLAKCATEAFGPMGIGWGVDVVDECYKDGHIIDAESGQRSVIHVLRICLWYNHDGQKGTVYHYGQTTFIGANKFGPFTDEEAPKKSLTDATTKALSMLGFGADIFMGQYDDAEYRQEVTDQFLLEHADDKDAEKARQADEYATWRIEHMQLLKTAQSAGETKRLFTLMTRKMARHNDANGLRLIESLRDERLTDLREAAAKKENANASA